MTSSWIKLLALLPALAVPALGCWPGAAFSEQRSAAAASAARSAGLLVEDTDQARVIVKYRSGSALMQRAGTAQALAANPVRPQHASALAARLGLSLTDGRVLGQRTQALHGQGLSSNALAQRLAAHPDVEWAVADQRRSIAGVTPNDPLFAAGQTSTTPAVGQWYLRASDNSALSAINALGAWATSTGSASVTVAVLDTGVRFDHPDLAGKLWPGYDFVIKTTGSADGDGRDDDASDPGDWSVASDSCGAANSSWHGTQVAGLIGAASDNGIGMAGVGRNVMLLPVRVLGKCGGYDSDIVTGLRWAAGLSNAAGCSSTATRSETCNPHPAQVINMSLGSTGTCSATSNQVYFDAIKEVVAAGVSVVVAAGNEAGLAVNVPANCAGALAVAAVRHVGTKVGFSSIGPEVAIAAPGGNCVNTSGACLYPLLSTTNTGTSVPGSASYSTSYSYEVGTSFSAPLVAGTVALMLSVDPTLTPASIKTALQASARSFPTSGALSATAVACQAPSRTVQDECYCTTTTCGAGLLDAGAAVARVDGLKVVLSAAKSVLSPGEQVTLASAQSSVHAGRSIASYEWTLVSSPTGGAVLTTDVTAPQVSVKASQIGHYAVSLKLTDTAGISSQASTVLVVASAPAASIGGTATVAVGSTLTMSGATSTADATDGVTVAGYAWSIGTNSVGASVVGASNAASVVVSANAVGTFPLSLTVTDSLGQTATAATTVTVTAAPVVVTAPATSSGGGGGAMGLGWLLALALAIAALWRQPARGGRG